jgi:hypothetical protein
MLDQVDNHEKNRLLLLKIVAFIFLIILSCILSREILFFALCIKQDVNIPSNTELLVSSCKDPHATSVPGGEYVFIYEGRTKQTYLLDLHTKLKIKVRRDPLLLQHGVFLNSELVWLEGSLGGLSNPLYTPHYILDLATGKRYQLMDLTGWYGQPKHPDYIHYFQSAEKVFVHHGFNRAIALPPNFPKTPAVGVILYESPQTMENGASIEFLMKELEVKYENIDYSLRYVNIFSPTGKYFANREGIYLSDTNIPIPMPQHIMYRFTGWYYDESGIIYNEYGKCYLIILTTCLYHIPGNVLKLNLATP